MLENQVDLAEEELVWFLLAEDPEINHQQLPLKVMMVGLETLKELTEKKVEAVEEL